MKDFEAIQKTRSHVLSGLLSGLNLTNRLVMPLLG